ncbi:DUF4175 domain-containing protein [Anaeromyxobacter paludicola]|uniref:DUF4175 family protein n=1 Tax=Anaeromyxobacter paludicola TaxID=2918171 RepID=A0ABM7XCM1_9BACT|nr:DUF4175 domain-containing protein [Anaeromyxobacter paludicola]BDG09621.1 hypothetical protein AMPC_27340 [Anaeromyxobacter paludicola]
MSGSYPQIARVLDGARRREALVVLGTAAGWGLAAGLAVLLLGALALAGWPGRAPALRLATLGAAAIALACAAGWAAVALFRRAAAPEAVARTVAEAEPALRSDLVSAVELERERAEIAADGRYSVALLDAHLDDTARRAVAVDLSRAIPSLPARRALGALGAMAALHLLGLALGWKPLAAGWTLLTARGAAALAARADPITGDVELVYRYPAYMSRAPRTLSGTGGEVSAPRGTEVTLRTRADRDVAEAEIVLEESGAAPLAAPPQPSPPERGGSAAAPPQASPSAPLIPSPAPAGEGQGGGAAPRSRIIPVTVQDRRGLTASFQVDAPGSYRFRFKKGRRVVAEGPPIPVVLEPDAFPEVRITAPAAELEVRSTDPVRVDWSASDDYGLSDLTLVTKLPAGDEERRPLKQFSETRREGGSLLLDLAAYRLAEGEKLLYWLEVRDNDAVSGPKRAASATHAVKLYSEAEHHRALLEQARALWEQLVGLLGDRLAFRGGEDRAWTDTRAAQALALDARAKKLHQDVREAALAMKKERAAPKELPAALANVAAGLRAAEQQLTALHQTVARMLQFSPGETGGQLQRRAADLDDAMDAELEKDVLYLEQLLDRRRAEDLLHLAQDLAARRRDLAQLLDQYKQSPSDAAKKQLLAEIGRMKRRMQEMAQRMAELAKGINDEHMNAEALAELQKSRDLAGGMDEVEKKLAQGDLEGAMKALDAMGSAMQDMLAGLERTAGEPGRRNAGLMKEMLAFKDELGKVRAEQQQVESETGAIRQQYRKKVGEKLAQLKGQTRKLQQLAEQARREVEASRQAVPQRPDDDAQQARDRLGDAGRALGAQDLDAALDSARRAAAPLQRLATSLEDEARFARLGQLGQPRDARQLEEAARHAGKALPLARELRQQLEQLFPDPKGLLGKAQQEQLDRLSKRQDGLQRRAGELRQKLSELAQKAPVFPPEADQQMSEAQGEMMQAAGELAQRDPQRGQGHQRQAMDSLDRFQKGLEEVAKNARPGGGGDGFPFPFGQTQPGSGQGDGEDAPSPEKVEIPGAEAYKAPEEFRKDLLDAMKQGAPQTYEGEVKRYYQELVK